MSKAAIPRAASVSRRSGATAKTPRPTAGCLFSGMGGFASGLIRAGFVIRWASDNDEFACAAFRHRLPTIPLVEKDVRELSVQSDGLNKVDVLAAGFPCQSFSQAGSRLGFEDERGKLFFEIPRIITEFKGIISKVTPRPANLAAGLRPCGNPCEPNRNRCAGWLEAGRSYSAAHHARRKVGAG